MTDPSIQLAKECLREASIEFQTNVSYYGRLYDFYVPKYDTVIDFSAQDVIDRQCLVSDNKKELELGFRVIIISFAVEASDKDILQRYLNAALTDSKYRIVCLSKSKGELLYLGNSL